MRRERIGLLVLFIVGLAFLFTSCAQRKSAEDVQASAQNEMKMGDRSSGSQQFGDDGELKMRANTQGLEGKIAEFENENIYFDYDRYTLSPKAKAVLKGKAAFLKAHPDLTVQVQGNCDERGTAEYNMALGERRARAAQEYFIALGIAKERISIISYGEERPVDPESNEQAWAKNRNDQFGITNK